jgi:hypothetical protein
MYKWFCTQNILIFFTGIIAVMVGYLYYILFMRLSVDSKTSKEIDPVIQISIPRTPSCTTTVPHLGVLTNPDPRVTLSNPYNPPLKIDPILLSKKNDITQDIVLPSLPININTSTIDTPYTQMGILTKQNGKDREPVILPLMGRNLLNGRDKWMYYTMTNSAGSINTRLPVRVNGKNGMNEYGCDMIYNGDTVYVDGYNDTFSATIYENAVLRYLPII